MSNGLAWNLRPGDNLAEASAGGIRLAQREAKDTSAYAAASTPIRLKGAPIWRVSFEVRFGELRSTGSGVRLLAGNRAISMIGADGASGSMTATMEGASGGHHAEKVAPGWQACELIGNGKMATLWLNACKIGEGAIPGPPDSLEIGALGSTPGRQTEILVRSVSVSPAHQTAAWFDLFNGRSLAGWTGPTRWRVDGGILRSVGGGDPDYLKFAIPVSTNAYVLSLRVRVIDGMRLRIFVAHGPTLLAHLAGIYFGNEGDTRQVALYGKDLANIKTLASGHYEPGQWLDLRLEVDAEGHAALLQNDTLTYSATRTNAQPVWLALCPGDGYSPGHIEIASVRLLATAEGMPAAEASMRLALRGPRP